ncbi:MAG: hypothetical protein JW863_08100 [Chitinispirillaceae bacterium]|nr:hypothetical protein [Chitinispirillaceae bacterium]
MKPHTVLLLLLLCTSCLFHPPAVQTGRYGPLIDSSGFQAAQARLQAVDETLGDSLIAQALAVQNDSMQTNRQSAFFESLEENYQRYLKLFTPLRHAPEPEIRCRYDLVETFKRRIYDPQPLLNAILHSMGLTDVATLDFRVEPKNSDTTLVYVLLTRTRPNEAAKGFTVSEDDVILAVTGNRAVLMTSVE